MWLQSSITRMPSAPLLHVPVVRTFILHSGDEAQYRDGYVLCACVCVCVCVCGVRVWFVSTGAS